MALLDNTRKILNNFGKKSVAQMKKNANRYKATGRMADSFRHEMSKKGMTIYGVDYTLYHEEGRGPTQAGGSGVPLRVRLIEWLKVKNIPLWRDEKGRFISRATMAFVIARKIHRDGVSWYGKKERDIYSSVLTPEKVGAVITQMEDELEAQIITDVMKLFVIFDKG